MSYVSYQQSPMAYAQQGYTGAHYGSQYQQPIPQQQYQQPMPQQYQQQYQQPIQQQQPVQQQQQQPVQQQIPVQQQHPVKKSEDLAKHTEIKNPNQDYIVAATPIHVSPSSAPVAKLTDEEMQSLEEMKRRVQEEPDFKEFVTEPMMIEFLMARKFEVDRALVLLRSHMNWRRENGILNRDNLRLDPVILHEIESGKLLTDTSSRDGEGAQIVYFRPSLMSKTSETTTTQDFCRAVFFLLQRCISDPITQRQGFLFICDLRGTKMTSVDYRLIRAVIDMLQNRFPGRLKRVLLLEPPRFFKMAFKMIKPLIAEKYLQKMCIVTMPEILDHAPASGVLKEYGGDVDYDHSRFIEAVRSEEKEKKLHGEAVNPNASVTGVPLA